MSMTPGDRLRDQRRHEPHGSTTEDASEADTSSLSDPFETEVWKAPAGVNGDDTVAEPMDPVAEPMFDGARVTTDDLIDVVAPAPTTGIDDSYISMEEEAADEEGGELEPPPEPKQPGTTEPTTDPAPAPAPEPEIIDYTEGWRGGPDELMPDEVVAQTDEDGVPLEDDTLDLGL